LAQIASGSDHDSLSASLDDLRTRGRSNLRTALPALGWPERITTSRALGALGETVVTVQQVSGVRSGFGLTRIWTLRIRRSGFQSGAILLGRVSSSCASCVVPPTASARTVGLLGLGWLRRTVVLLLLASSVVAGVALALVA
jgi:hypothetical protein